MGERRMPYPGQFYEHFKGRLYQVIGIAKHSETREEMVVYQALYGDFSLYCRPLTMFMSEVDHVKYPDVSATYRFTAIDREQLTKNVVNDTITPSMEKKEEVTEIEQHPEASLVNKDLMSFLEAKDYGEKLEILYNMKKRIDDRLMSDIEMSLDIPVGEGDIEKRLQIVRDNLSTMAKFETKRLR